MYRKLLLIAGSSGALCVALGAMGAHFLKEKITPENLQTFETAVRYQMYHTLALLLIAIISEKYNSNLLRYAGYFFIVGIVFFSGSLYLLSTRSLLEVEDLGWIGAITPIGGMLFIAGWLFIFTYGLRLSKKN